jgi:Uma2 family endonuclease
MAVVTAGEADGEAETEVPVAASPIGGEPFTWDYLQTLPDDGLRRELVDGQLIVSPSPVGRHQAAVLSLGRILVSACPGDLRVTLSPYDWKLSATTVFVPDLMVIRQADFDLDGWFTGTPLLVVEVRSPSTAATDRTLKRQQYERYGAGAYWLVDPGGRDDVGRVPSLTALRLVDGAFREEATVQGDEPYAAGFPFPVTVVPAALVE